VREEDPCDGKGRDRIARGGQVGTSVYMSPERVGGQDYSFNADVW
jgi:serine/threonine protein kinase